MTNRVGSSVSVVVPTYGNALGLEPLARDISEILQRENRTFEILFVNDGSPDATWDAIQRIHLSNPEKYHEKDTVKKNHLAGGCRSRRRYAFLS
jgi:glycosyltransferase involved in cell wall biosynthesis